MSVFFFFLTVSGCRLHQATAGPGSVRVHRVCAWRARVAPDKGQRRAVPAVPAVPFPGRGGAPGADSPDDADLWSAIVRQRGAAPQSGRFARPE